MTLSEALQRNKVRTLEASNGDNINRICYRLYESLSPVLIHNLMMMNKRYDWELLKPGAGIQYLPKEVMLVIE